MQLASPTNRSSLFGWVKSLKRAGLTLSDSLNDVSDCERALPESKSPTRSVLLPAMALPPRDHDLLKRPGSHVNRVRSNLALTLLVRQHRDLFMQSNPLVDEKSQYFGVPLADAVAQALAKISILGLEDLDNVLQYGAIPIVVAKCGVYLKKNGLHVEGIFRVGGLLRRIRELQLTFNSPPDFGKKLLWEGYTVHDAASVLKRYLNALPEPLIPLQLYERFRAPLRLHPRIIKYMQYKAENPRRVRDAEGDESEPRRSKSRTYKKLTGDVYDCIAEYKELLEQLPPLSKQLLFYVLDLLAMVQNNSSENLMLLRNLAAIFQPLILSHPDHDLDPDEYLISQSAVQFLIQYAYKLLPGNEPSREPSESPNKTPDMSTLSLVQGRQKSKSFLVNNDDMIGSHPAARPKRSLNLSDTDHGFMSSEDDEGGYPNLLQVAAETPPIVVSLDTEHNTT